METSPNLITHVPGTVQVRTTVGENNTTPAKRRRRCLGPQERRVVAEKRRIGVCSSCRRKKITCRHVLVFQDQESDLPTPKESNERYKAALGIKDKNRRIQTNNEGWVLHTPQDFRQTPSRDHNLKQKRRLIGDEASRGKANAPPDSEIQSRATEESLRKPTDSIENIASNIIDLTHTDDDVSPDISAGEMASTGPPQIYPSMLSPTSNTNFYGGLSTYQYPTLSFENLPVLATASGSYSYDNPTEGQFELPFLPGPQTSQAVLGNYYTPVCLPPSSESGIGSEGTSTQLLAPLFPDAQQAWNIPSQAPGQNDMFTSNPSERSPPNHTSPQTPSRRIEIPSLDFTSSTVESQGQASFTTHGLTGTPTRNITGEQRSLAILGNGLELLHEVELLKECSQIGEFSGDESFEDYLMRDICKHTVYLETSV